MLLGLLVFIWIYLYIDYQLEYLSKVRSGKYGMGNCDYEVSRRHRLSEFISSWVGDRSLFKLSLLRCDRDRFFSIVCCRG